ncbi:MAG: hypothetical protein Ct9H300mP32_6130 [Verrucomicrobiota bacterium]|nr:MAG: hypothetical protein Ct9H300mP32_6130 [Verrucomicrobiota bacterium]
MEIHSERENWSAVDRLAKRFFSANPLSPIAHRFMALTHSKPVGKPTPFGRLGVCYCSIQPTRWICISVWPRDWLIRRRRRPGATCCRRSRTRHGFAPRRNYSFALSKPDPTAVEAKAQ